MRNPLFLVTFAAASAIAVACGGGATTGSADAGPDPAATGDGAAADVDGPLPKFSFFVTSYRSNVELSGSRDGFGGDLSFGETGPGAGLRGADKICATIAEKSLPGARTKPWRAFLSVIADESGKQVDAIDRIGEGPWYDRLGRVVALRKADLLHPRPSSADPLIRADLPNEEGIPNHYPNPDGMPVDNHHMLTGSNEEGRLFAADATCLDWTSAKGNSTTEGRPRMGLAFPQGLRDDGTLRDHWISELTESGCLPGVVTIANPNRPQHTVGTTGGYGGFYCFSTVP